ncbi:MAG: LPS export ABC transporter periplasmic protein LptC [Myxococcota bacterium]
MRRSSIGGMGALLVWLLASSAGAASPSPETTLEDVVFQGFRPGESGYRVHASRARVDWVRRVAHLESVKIVFEGREGQEPIRVRSDRGLVYLNREDLELSGNVEGDTATGDTFRSDRARYDQEHRRLTGKGHVRVERTGRVYEGAAMELDLDSREVRFRGKVRVRVEP